MKRTIYLIGFMGAGKTSTLQWLQNKYHMTGVDLDTEIEREAKTSISSLFSEYGEEEFRRMETQALMRTGEEHYDVVACGGGILEKEENVKFIKAFGRPVWLEASIDTVSDRLKEDRESVRPLFLKSTEEEFVGLWARRRDGYRQSAEDVIVTDGLSEEEVCDRVYLLTRE